MISAMIYYLMPSPHLPLYPSSKTTQQGRGLPRLGAPATAYRHHIYFGDLTNISPMSVDYALHQQSRGECCTTNHTQRPSGNRSLCKLKGDGYRRGASIIDPDRKLHRRIATGGMILYLNTLPQIRWAVTKV